MVRYNTDHCVPEAADRTVFMLEVYIPHSAVQQIEAGQAYGPQITVPRK